MTKQSFRDDGSTAGTEIVQLVSPNLEQTIGSPEQKQDFENKSKWFEEKTEPEDSDYSLFDCVSFD